MSTRFHPTTKLNTNTQAKAYAQPADVAKVKLTSEEALKAAITEATAKAKAKKGARLNKAETAAIVAKVTASHNKHEAMNAKAKAVGTTIGKSAKTTAVVTGKLGKTAWNGTFGLLKGAISVVQAVPNVAVAGAVVAGNAVRDEYRKA